MASRRVVYRHLHRGVYVSSYCHIIAGRRGNALVFFSSYCHSNASSPVGSGWEMEGEGVSVCVSLFLLEDTHTYLTHLRLNYLVNSLWKKVLFAYQGHLRWNYCFSRRLCVSWAILSQTTWDEVIGWSHNAGGKSLSYRACNGTRFLRQGQGSRLSSRRCYLTHPPLPSFFVQDILYLQSGVWIYYRWCIGVVCGGIILPLCLCVIYFTSQRQGDWLAVSNPV